MEDEAVAEDEVILVDKKPKFRLGELFSSREESGVAGLPVLSVTMNDGLVHRDTLDRKTDGKLTPKEHLLIRKGDIAYNMMRMWQGASGLARQDGIVSPAYVVVTPSNAIDPTFAFYWFKSARMIHLFWAYSYGITGDRLRLYYRDFAKIPVTVLSKKAQVRIGKTLAAADRAIARMEDLIDAKQRLKEGLDQQLLSGKCRLLDYDSTWTEYRLGALFKERRESNCVDLPLLSVTRKSGVVPHSDANRKDSSAQDKSKYKRIMPGDIGYNTMRMWQGISALSPLEGIISPAYTVCIPNPRISGSFARHLFKFPPIVHLFYRYSQGLVSDTWSLKFRYFAQIRVGIPSIREQERIAAILHASDWQIQLLEKRLVALIELKRGLMQRLFADSTSKVRLAGEENRNAS